MSQSIADPIQSKGLEALNHLEKALQILDDIEVPENIGAHVDLAICQFKDILQTWQGAQANSQ
jgi:hypothetical protein